MKLAHMKKIIINAQAIVLGVLGLLTLLILGAEPGTTEQSMYEYQHAFDYGHAGWFLIWGWVVVLIIFIALTVLRFIISTNE